MGIDMNAAGWRYIDASAVGTSHSKSGTPCQDSYRCELRISPAGEQVFIAVVADGAGSAARAEVGSALVCETFITVATNFIETGAPVTDVSEPIPEQWVIAIREKVTEAANSEGRAARDFAATMLAVVVGRDHAACLQIGDGAIVVADSEEGIYQPVFWPDRGEYANTTNFVTEGDALEHLQFTSINRNLIEVAILSDGLQGIALNYQQRSAHEPFFKGFFSPLRREPSGRREKLSDSLTSFLSSSIVNEKTDDDKTLVLATRL
jgi:hypothetical protein